ncbi:hypothetical protein PTTG_04144 [Puccinia triticina 1-1 BBBD Race 1]|uniref:Uncharacterized protein n=1 Tax=Puccinia triticina (isolate 1-1 / race 1 (BBBD)) TaxID=630390 RepID=A0A0C4ETL5_PUCT1|nr:hypothetical protein PTTG_04144 [Puccinia triticina 1-1 BBBD Race 1]
MYNPAHTPSNRVPATENGKKPAQDMENATAAAQAPLSVILAIPTLTAIKGSPTAIEGLSNTTKDKTVNQDIIPAIVDAQDHPNIDFVIPTVVKAPLGTNPAPGNVLKAPNLIQDAIDPLLIQLNTRKKQ